MSREIKFRAWATLHNEMRVGEAVDLNALRWQDRDKHYHFMQFTGLKDKNGVEIYEGDIIRHRRPYRSYDDHYGENIPGPTNHYRQLLEPEIAEDVAAVEFDEGMFVAGKDSMPLAWLPFSYSKAEALGAFEYRHSHWDDAEEGELQYLLETYRLESESALIAYLGTEVIGNIYENPELLSPGAKGDRR